MKATNLKNRDRNQVSGTAREVHPYYNELQENFVWENENKATALFNIQSLGPAAVLK